MGVTTLFLPQLKIDLWTAGGVVEFDGTSLAIEGEDPSIDLEPAVRFVQEVGGGEDPGELVGKIKKITEIEEMGAEHFRDSVILDDTAYEVVEGYIATPRRIITEVAKTSYGNEEEEQQWKRKGTSAKNSKPPPAEPESPAEQPHQASSGDDEDEPQQPEKSESEADELARLLLEKL